MRRISIRKLESLFSYDPETGILSRYNGQEAGWKNGQGYREVQIGKRTYQVSWVIWAIIKGKCPKRGMEIDHKNLIKDDNRWGNLRKATHGQNQANSLAYKNNSSGLKGVGKPDKKNGKFYPYIQYKKKRIRLGGFCTALEAHEAYAAAAKKYHQEFARY